MSIALKLAAVFLLAVLSILLIVAMLVPAKQKVSITPAHEAALALARQRIAARHDKFMEKLNKLCELVDDAHKPVKPEMLRLQASTMRLQRVMESSNGC